MENIPYVIVVGSLMYANGRYYTIHCSCTGSIEHVYVDTRKRALDGCEKRFLVLKRNDGLWDMLSRKTSIWKRSIGKWVCRI